jgi:hypothetical protein
LPRKAPPGEEIELGEIAVRWFRGRAAFKGVSGIVLMKIVCFSSSEKPAWMVEEEVSRKPVQIGSLVDIT